MSAQACETCGGPLPDARPNRRYCSENCRKRRWDREIYRHPCPDCGASIDRRRVRCGGCEIARRHVRHEALLARVEAMYNAGEPMRAIAAMLGRSTAAGTGAAVSRELDELRKAGRIGYRYTMENGRRVAP